MVILQARLVSMTVPAAEQMPPSPFNVADILETLHDKANNVAGHAGPDNSA